MNDAEHLRTMDEELQFVRLWALMKTIRADVRMMEQRHRLRAAPYERKTFDVAIKSISDEGVFEGLAAVYFHKDEGGDLIEPGAFADALSKGTAHLPLLWNHDIHTVLGLVEISDSPAGLKVRGKLNLSVARSREIYALIKQGAARGLSIGYETLRSVMRGATRHLQAIHLFEVSVTPFPMQRLATIDTIKGHDPDVEQFRRLLRDMRLEMCYRHRLGT